MTAVRSLSFTSVGINVDNESTLISLIQQTIAKINKHSIAFTEIAYELGRITQRQYKVCEEKQKLEEIKLEEEALCQVYDDAEIIARIVSACINAALSDKTPSALKNSQQRLISSVFEAAKNNLKSTADSDQVVDTAVVLDQIDYAEMCPKDEVFVTIINRLHNAIVNQKIASQNIKRRVGLAVWTIFTLRKVMVVDNDNKLFKVLGECCFIILNNESFLTTLEISLVTKGLAQARQKSGFNFEKIDLLFKNLRSQVIKRSNCFTINEIVNTLWAFCFKCALDKVDPSIIRRQNEQIITTIESKLVEEMRLLNADQITRIGWTLQKMNLSKTNFFKVIRKRIDETKDNLTPSALVNNIKRLCNNREGDDSVLVELINKLLNAMECFTIDMLAEVSYYILIKFCENDKNFAIYKDFIYRTLKHMVATKLCDWKNEHLWRLRIIIAIYEGICGKLNEDLTMSLRKLFETLTPKTDKPTSSPFHLEVKKYLELLLSEYPKLPPLENEVPFEDGYFSLDMAFSSCKLAIEIDGSCHFDENGNYMPKDIIKETLLKIRGWHLVRITRKEWPKDDQVRRDFLLKKFGFFLDAIGSDDQGQAGLPRLHTSQEQSESSFKKALSDNVSKPILPDEWSKTIIASQLWRNPQTLISEDTMMKINAVRNYLIARNLELRGVEADGNCFCHAFLGSYATLKHKIPLLDEKQNKIAYLREVISSQYESSPQGSKNSTRADQIKKDKEWITALDEGDLLAVALSIPIRVIIVNIEEAKCGIVDMLTFTDGKTPRQTWDSIPADQKSKEHIIIVDIGGHFLYAEKSSNLTSEL